MGVTALVSPVGAEESVGVAGLIVKSVCVQTKNMDSCFLSVFWWKFSRAAGRRVGDTGERRLTGDVS